MRPHLDIEKISGPMRTCFQFQGMSMLDHGLDVRSWYSELRNHLLLGTPLERQWRMPRWIPNAVVTEAICRSDDLLMGLYQVYHDCGKPLCRTVDATGRQHFPDHAAVSRRRWLECSGQSESSLAIASLIGMDMDAHLLTPSGVMEFATRPQAIPLLVTALCEIHSNSQMFGGIDSSGFVSKHRRLDRLGALVLGVE